MKKLNVKTASTQAGKIVPVQLGTQCRRAMIKNFSAGDIWVGVTPDSTKTDGMIRIPSEGAQLLVSFCAGQYGDLIDTKKTVLKYRRWSGSYEKNRTGIYYRHGIYRCVAGRAV